MSVIDVNELYLNRGAQQDQDTTSITRAFQVISDDPTDDGLTILTEGGALGLPVVYEDLPSRPNDFWVRSLDPRVKSGDGLVWEVRVVYEQKPPVSVDDPTGNPWDLDPVISFGYMMRQRVFERCYAIDETIEDRTTALTGGRGEPDLPVQNSAKVWFDPPEMIDDALLTIGISRNTEHSDFDPAVLNKFVNTLNSAAVTVAGIVIGITKGWVRDYKATKAWTNANQPYWQENVEIVINPETWVKAIMDRGIMVAAESGSGGTASSPGNLVKYEKVLDEDGDQMREPVMLNGDGQRAGGGEPVYIEFHGYWEAEWGTPSTGMKLPANY